MTNKKIKAVIFDLDGTLINSIEDIADCANKILESKSLPSHPIDSYRQFVGNGLFMLMKRIMPDSTPELILHNCASEFKHIYESNWNNKTRPYPGIPQMLDQLLEIDLKIAVLSNKPDSFTRECVKGFFPEYNIFPVNGQREDIVPKPHPGGAIKIAKTLGIYPAECMFVGDSNVDIQTGRAAKMRTVGVSWGFRTKSELMDAGADTIINKPKELINHVSNH